MTGHGTALVVWFRAASAVEDSLRINTRDRHGHASQITMAGSETAR